MKNYLVAGIALLVVLAVSLYSAQVWMGMDDTELSGHGMIALGLGVVITLVVGGGLMGLIFYSNRRGYDERVGKDR